MLKNFNSVADIGAAGPDGPAGSFENDAVAGWGGVPDFSDSIAGAYDRIAELMEGICGHGMDCPDGPEMPAAAIAPVVPAPEPALTFSGERD